MFFSVASRIEVARAKLAQMRDYLLIVKDALEETQTDVIIQNAEFLESVDEEYKYEAEMVFEDDIDNITRSIPYLHYQSFIIVWYSFIEQELLELCERLKLDQSEKVNIDKLRNKKSIDKAKYLWKAVCAYEVNRLKHWSELQTVRNIRNQLVHSGRRIRLRMSKPDNVRNLITVPPLTEDACETYIYGDKSIKPYVYSYLDRRAMLRNSGPYVEIEPTYEYCLHLITIADEFFEQLFKDFNCN